MTKNDAEILHQYAAEVMHRGGSHASQIKGVALALLGGIIWRGDGGSLKLTQPHWPTLVLELEVDGHGYSFTDNFATGEIELRHRWQAGAALHSFGNDTPVEYVQAVFRGL
jgi:Integron cassette protein VCH_CASS1 chain